MRPANEPSVTVCRFAKEVWTLLYQNFSRT